MDFTMSFLIYIFVLSLFFYALLNTLTTQSSDLDIPAELLFNRVENIYNEDIDFLDGSIVDKSKLDNFISSYNQEERYNLTFREFHNPEFSRTDFCIFLEETKEGDKIIHDYFAAGLMNEYSIYFENAPDPDVMCNAIGSLNDNVLPNCPKNSESILLSKPVYYDNKIVNLKVYICSQK